MNDAFNHHAAKGPSRFFSQLPTTIFSTMSALAAKHGAINLGQGAPDTDGPAWLVDSAMAAFRAGPHKYAPSRGVPELRQAVAEAEDRFYGLKLDPDRNVLIASATEGLLATCLGLLDPGDEVIVLEPFYDSYRTQIAIAGGVPKFVRLEPPDWRLDEANLRAAFSERTKALILNTPMNPTGKVFTSAELSLIADVVREHDAYVICDEVYEHMVFGDRAHTPLATLPGMRDRCVRIGSAGKTFSMTGWRVGYVTGPESLLNPIAAAHQYITFALPRALQVAVADGLRAGDDYFAGLRDELAGKRRLLADGLTRAGFDVLPADGAYFIAADYRRVAGRAGFSGDDFGFASWLTENARVTAIPFSAFYADPADQAKTGLLRFCFAKKDDVLLEAARRLESVGLKPERALRAIDGPDGPFTLTP